MVIYLVQGMTFGFAAAVQPGPLQTYLISRSLETGWQRTIPAAFAPLISDEPIIVLALLVLSSMPLWFEQLLQTVGGFFLLYLAFSTGKTWRRYNAQQATRLQSTRMNVLKAVMVNVLNPNPYIGWMLVMGPLLMKGWRELPANGVALLLSFYGTMIISTMGIIVLFSTARSLGPRVNRTLIGLSAVGLAFLGIFQLWQGTMALWWM